MNSKIVVWDMSTYVSIHSLEKKPLFFGKNGKLMGSVIQKDNYYYMYTNPTHVHGGPMNSLKQLMDYGLEYGYTFYTDVNV